MAEAVAAFGVAAGVVSFVGFSWQLLDLCRQIHDSKEGYTTANQELKESTKALKELVGELKLQTATDRTSSKRVTTLGEQCLKDADEIMEIVDNVRAANGKRGLEAMKSAFRALRQGRSIEKLQNKMKQRMDALNACMLADIRKQNDDASIEQKTQLAAIQQQIGQLLQQLSEVHRGQQSAEASATARYTSMKEQLALVQANNKTIFRDISKIDVGVGKIILADERERFLSSLRFPGMTDRQERISPPSESTYEWIFDDGKGNVRSSADKGFPAQDHRAKKKRPGNQFGRWLKSDSSLFWINGKAGSGKSTLMNYIVYDRRTKAALKTWAADDTLYISSFFFWRAGTNLQKNILGLLRALLYQLCETIPAALDSICKALDLNANHPPVWNETNLSLCFKQAVQSLGKQRLAIFIDGLDEYEGDYGSLLDAILPLLDTAKTKLCVSSRPENVFANRLSALPTIRLQDLNLEDISRFVSNKFKSHGEPLTSLTASVAWRAEGIFLWAVLVSADLLQGYNDGDDRKMLQKRLARTPPELDALFAHMLASVDELHRKSLLFYLYAMKWHSTHETTVALVTASQLERKIESYTEFLNACHRTERQILARSRGLLEVRRSCLWKGTPTINLSLNHLRLSNASDGGIARCSQPELVGLWTYESSILEWVHRTAYDYVLGNEAQCISMWMEPQLERDFRLKLVQGHMTLLCDLPLFHGEGDDRVFRRIEYLFKVTPSPVKEGCAALDAARSLVQSSLGSTLSQTLCVRPFSHDVRYPGVDRKDPWYPSCLFWAACVKDSALDYVLQHLAHIQDDRYAHIISSYLIAVICAESGRYPSGFSRRMEGDESGRFSLRFSRKVERDLLASLMGMIRREFEPRWRSYGIHVKSHREYATGRATRPASEHCGKSPQPQAPNGMGSTGFAAQRGAANLHFQLIKGNQYGKPYMISRRSFGTLGENFAVSSLLETFFFFLYSDLGPPLAELLQLWDPYFNECERRREGAEGVYKKVHIQVFIRGFALLNNRKSLDSDLLDKLTPTLRLVSTSSFPTYPGNRALAIPFGEDLNKYVVVAHDLGADPTALITPAIHIWGGPARFSIYWTGQQDFVRCCEAIIDDIWMNREGRLTAWQQLYSLASIRTGLIDIRRRFPGLGDRCAARKPDDSGINVFFDS